MKFRLFYVLLTISICLVATCQQIASPPAKEEVSNGNKGTTPGGTPLVLNGKRLLHHADDLPEVLPLIKAHKQVQLMPISVMAPSLEPMALPHFDTTAQALSPRKVASQGEVLALSDPDITPAGDPGMSAMAITDIKHWSIEQNLATASIWTMIQDKRGDLWLGSMGEGAIRFNGSRFEHFFTEEGLGCNHVFSLLEDSKGNIWFGTMTGGVIRFDGQVFTRFTTEHGLCHNFVLSILEDHAGNIWFGTRGGLCRYDGSNFTQYTTQEGLVFNEVISLYEDRSQRLWVGTGEGSGMHLFDGERFIHFDVGAGKGSNDVHAILEDRRGNMWFGTWGGGVIKYDGKKFARLKTTQGLISDNVLSIREDHAGKLWFGCFGGGVTRYDGAFFTHYTQDAGLSSKDVRLILEDAQNNIWACTLNGGINRISALGTQQLAYTDPWPMEGVGSVIQSRQGDLWMSGPTGPLKYDGDRLTRYTHPKSLIHEGVVTLFEDRKNNLWAGTEGGISVISEAGIQDYIHRSVPLAGNVRAILEDRNGNIWLGTYAAGLIRFDGQSFTQYSVEEGFISDDIYTLYEDSRGNLWIGTQGNGVCRFDGQYFTPFTINDGLSHNYVRAILEDPQGNMWFGTDKGLSCYDGSNFTTYTTKDGLIQNKIFSLSLHNNRIWVSSQKGISSFRTDELGQLGRQGSKKEIQFLNLDKQYGLGPGTLSPGRILIDDTDRLWIKNANGVSILDLSKLENTTHLSATLKITDVYLNGKHIDYRALATSEWKHNSSGTATDRVRFGEVSTFYNLPQDLVVPYSLNQLSFYCAATDWNAPSKVKYSFWLEDIDKDWSSPQKEAKMEYRNLPPGHFTLNVKAQSWNGKWSEPIAFRFEITPPWWRTSLAYLLYVLLVLTTLYLIYKVLLTRKLAIDESKRLKEIDELKADIYTNITHEFRTPITVINGMANELEEYTEQSVATKAKLIKKHSHKLLQMVNQLLQLSKLEVKKEGLNLQHADIILILKYVVASFEALASTKNISLQFQSTTPSRYMLLDEKKIAIILSNLLANALKFTPENGQISVNASTVTVHGHPHVNLAVKDNGIGIAAEDLPTIFDRFQRASRAKSYEGTGIGLAITHELVSLMGGNIQVVSTPGQGSLFSVQLPIRQRLPSVSAARHHPLTTPVTAQQELPVLLMIEDQPDIIKYLQYCLQDHYNLLICTNGEQGIDTAIEAIPDLILSDIMMPGKDGLELCRFLKEDKRTNHIPILLLTAKVGHEYRLQGLASGADAYLTKPFDKAELMIRLNNLLKAQKTLQQKYLKELQQRYQLSSRQEDNSTTRIDFLVQVEQEIAENLSNDSFSVDQLAGALNLSPSQLNRKIKASTGMSTTLYIRYIRLLGARNLLQNTTLTVSEVLYQVGFNSPAYFSKIYKAQFGKKPSEERVAF